MLPSMPLLMTPVKELDDSSDSSDDSPIHHSVENGHASRGVNGSHPTLTLNLCPLESSRESTSSSQNDKAREITNSPEKRTSSEPTSAQKRKKKTQQHKKTLAALTPDFGSSLDASAQNFAESYFQKVRSRLDNEKWELFVKEIVDFEEQVEKKPADLYRKMEILLQPYTDLVDEFLGFLLPCQALEVNRFMPYLLLIKMNEFFRKANILLMKRQVRQIYSALEALTVKPNVSLSDVKTSILPLLKSNSLLTNLFLELLPGEKPPDSLMTDFEQVDLKDDSEFETIVVPDCPDPYGSENCICTCHATQTRHCVSCGIKYLNGRVYLQYGKVLRPAKVIFKDKKHLDLQKWEEEKRRNRRRLLPKTVMSPGPLDHRLNADSEDDCAVKKSPRTPRIRVARPKVPKKQAIENKGEEVLEGIFPLPESKNAEACSENVTEELMDCGVKSDGLEEHEFDEIVMENECNTEEEEEEYLNKDIHSENDSSLEAEDILKELESGNDYSFEDEEVEDMENCEVEPNDTPKKNVPNEKENHSNTVVNTLPEPCDSVNDSYEKHNFETEIVSGEKEEQFPEVKLEANSPQTEQEAEVKIEPISKSPKQSCDENLPKDDNLECNIKTEPEETIMDVCNDNISFIENDCNSGAPPKVSGSGSSEIESSWTREEDKIILQTFQHENDLEQTFETASLQLPNRSKEEIQERFEVLMKLLKEMISDKTNTSH